MIRCDSPDWPTVTLSGHVRPVTRRQELRKVGDTLVTAFVDSCADPLYTDW